MIFEKQASVFALLKSQSTSVSDIFNNLTIDLYPNPASDKINIRFSNLPEIGTRIVLYDITGKQLISQLVQSTNEVMDVQSQPAGIYLAKTVSGDNYKVNKLIINWKPSWSYKNKSMENSN